MVLFCKKNNCHIANLCDAQHKLPMRFCYFLSNCKLIAQGLLSNNIMDTSHQNIDNGHGKEHTLCN